MAPTILSIGALTLDITFALDRWPQPRSAVHAERSILAPGGKGLNQAVAARRLGTDVALVGCTGQDFAGDYILQTIRQEGIDPAFISRHPTLPTTVVTMLVHGQEPGFIAAPQASRHIQAEDVRRAVESLPEGSLVLVSYEASAAVVETALEAARQRELRTILNPAPLHSLDRDPAHLALVDVLIPNLHEGRIIVGNGEAAPEDVLRRLLRTGVGAVCLTLGEQGCIFAHREAPNEILRQPAFPVDVVDTTGASDAFCGAFAVGLLEGRSMPEILRLAALVSSLTCTAYGVLPALPRREIVNRHL
ncbi:MAG: ribokinase [Anaerolineae bacterium]|nr:ribokinase [Anaerolineae bacterium]